MDDLRFDAITRSLATSRSRRATARLLGGLGFGGLLGALAVRDPVAAKRFGGLPCNRDEQCKTGKCRRNKCTCSKEFPDCVQPVNRCKTAVCKRGRCVKQNTAADTPCKDDGDLCTVDVCDGNGRCKHPAKDCGQGKICLANGSCTTACVEDQCPSGCFCGESPDGVQRCSGNLSVNFCQEPPCSTDADCIPGQGCTELACPGGASGRCIPVCEE